MDRINFITIISKIILYISNLIIYLIIFFLTGIYLIRHIKRKNTINKRYILITLIRKLKFKNKYIKKELAEIRDKKIQEKEAIRKMYETLEKQKNNNLGGIKYNGIIKIIR